MVKRRRELSAAQEDELVTAEQEIAADCESVVASVKDEPKGDSDDPQEKELSDAVHAQKLKSRTPLYQRFMRDNETGGASDEWRQADCAKRKLLQQQWLETKLAEHRVSKTRTFERTKMDRRRGKWYSLRDLATREGIQKAKSYAKKCFARGSDWVEWDSMWEHFKYFEIHKEWEDTVAQGWSMRCTSSGTPQAVSASSSSTPALAAPPALLPITDAEPAGKKKKMGKKKGTGHRGTYVLFPVFCVTRFLIFSRLGVFFFF